MECSVADPDPGSGAFLIPASGVRDPGWVKIKIRILDHVSESLETIFGLKYLNSLLRCGSGIFLTLDLGSGMKNFGSGIQDKQPGFATLLTYSSCLHQHPGSYLRQLTVETIFWVKNTSILWCGCGSGIRNLFDPWSGIWDEKIRIRDKQPGESATLVEWLNLSLTYYSCLPVRACWRVTQRASVGVNSAPSSPPSTLSTGSSGRPASTSILGTYTWQFKI